MELKLRNITAKELKEIRYKQWLKQGKKCPLLNQEIDYSEAVADHKHKRKTDKNGIDGNGLLRGVIHRNANVLEGKITNAFKRYGLLKFIKLPDFLRNLADYLEHCPMEGVNIVHPTEREWSVINKREFNKISKWYSNKYPKKKELKYPCRGRIGKVLSQIIKEHKENEC